MSFTNFSWISVAEWRNVKIYYIPKGGFLPVDLELNKKCKVSTCASVGTDLFPIMAMVEICRREKNTKYLCLSSCPFSVNIFILYFPIILNVRRHSLTCNVSQDNLNSLVTSSSHSTHCPVLSLTTPLKLCLEATVYVFRSKSSTCPYQE